VFFHLIASFFFFFFFFFFLQLAVLGLLRVYDEIHSKIKV
jgi:hypothetical protein